MNLDNKQLLEKLDRAIALLQEIVEAKRQEEIEHLRAEVIRLAQLPRRGRPPLSETERDERERALIEKKAAKLAAANVIIDRAGPLERPSDDNAPYRAKSYVLPALSAVMGADPPMTEEERRRKKTARDRESRRRRNERRREKRRLAAAERMKKMAALGNPVKPV